MISTELWGVFLFIVLFITFLLSTRLVKLSVFEKCGVKNQFGWIQCIIRFNMEAEYCSHSQEQHGGNRLRNWGPLCVFVKSFGISVVFSLLGPVLTN